MTPAELGYSWEFYNDKGALPELPPGFYACRANSQVPVAKDDAFNRAHIRYSWGYGWHPLISTAIGSLANKGTCSCWPARYAVIATNLPGYGQNCDYTHVDEGGVI